MSIAPVWRPLLPVSASCSSAVETGIVGIEDSVNEGRHNSGFVSMSMMADPKWVDSKECLGNRKRRRVEVDVRSEDALRVERVKWLHKAELAGCRSRPSVCGRIN